MLSCFRLQRYKLLKAIHNRTVAGGNIIKLFQTTKIQTFESNSQRRPPPAASAWRCFRLQRYKLLKAIHNEDVKDNQYLQVVSDYKDTNFWKQFTTIATVLSCNGSLFQTTKIQTFESNSQPEHESFRGDNVVSDYKDTNFWKQFTT